MVVYIGHPNHICTMDDGSHLDKYIC